MSFGGDFEDIVENIRLLQAQNPGLKMVVLEGKSMRTKDELFDELTEKLKFPDYFGRNFDALDDCITDLAWLEFDSIVLVIKDSKDVLNKAHISRISKLLRRGKVPAEVLATDNLSIFLDSLCSAGIEWSQPVESGNWWDRLPVPFHTILVQKEISIIKYHGTRQEIPVIGA
ncbi:MAG: barstar family protein [Armatimonadota bacterium]